jgi:hypothetical protein
MKLALFRNLNFTKVYFKSKAVPLHATKALGGEEI